MPTDCTLIAELRIDEPSAGASARSWSWSLRSLRVTRSGSCRQSIQLLGKRRRALLESNAPSNTHERGGSKRQPMEARSTPCLLFSHIALPPYSLARATNPFISNAGGEPLLWLEKLPQGPERSDGPEEAGSRRLPASLGASATAGRRLCLIACNTRQMDEFRPTVHQQEELHAA
jgi:hypothetical protein